MSEFLFSLLVLIFSSLVCAKRNESRVYGKRIEKAEYTKMYEEPAPEQLAFGWANYTCDESNSFFKAIHRYYEDQTVFNCNSYSTGIDNTEIIFGKTWSNRKFNLSATRNTFGYYDTNGNEEFVVLGRIDGHGPCRGDYFFLHESNRAYHGSCTSDYGVTEVRSVKAGYAIKGKCESTCSRGRVVVFYQPGKVDEYVEGDY